MIDFPAVAASLLSRSRELLPAWFPAGKMHGHEFCIGNLQGDAGESLKINVTTGRWADFADGGGVQGGDLLSLYAAIHGIKQSEAAKQLGNGHDHTVGSPREPALKPERKVHIPARTDPPEGLFIHPVHGKPTARWDYRDFEGMLLGCIVRYDPAEGRKQIIPYTDADGPGWSPGQWPAPRPLYRLDRLAAMPDKPILIVEGEKAADAAQVLVGEQYAVLTWPGGCKAWRKAAWRPVYRRRILLWPDADEPGAECMAEIAATLAPRCPEVKLLSVVGQPPGWDAADALAEGWDWEKLVAWAKPIAKVVARPTHPDPREEPPPPSVEPPSVAPRPEPTEPQGPSRAPPPSTPYPLSWSSLAGMEPPARRWAVHGWLGFGHTTLLVGPGGIGKTLLAQQMASAMAVNHYFIDEVRGPLRTLMWACEDDHDELWRRQVALSHWLEAGLDAFSENLFIVPRHGLDNALCTTEYGKLMFTPRLEELRVQALDLKAEVVILDNVAQLYGGNENDRHCVTVFLNALAGSLPGCAILLLAHPARSLGSEFSGSSAWENTARTRLYLGTHLPDEKNENDEEEPQENVRFLSRRKANYSSKDWRRFTYNAGALIPDEVENHGGMVAHLRDKATERIILDGLRRLHLLGIRASEGGNSPQYLPRVLLEHKMSEGRTRSELGAAMRRMRLDGKIVLGNVGKYANRNPIAGLVLANFEMPPEPKPQVIVANAVEDPPNPANETPGAAPDTENRRADASLEPEPAPAT